MTLSEIEGFLQGKCLPNDLLVGEKRAAYILRKFQTQTATWATSTIRWKPEFCPISGKPFFMWIDHPELGYVPTYGGPYDSFTIPVADADGEFSCERYDHDYGGWVDGESLSVRLIDNSLEILTDSIRAEIGAKTVDVLLKAKPSQLIALMDQPRQVTVSEENVRDVIEALRKVAGNA